MDIIKKGISMKKLKAFSNSQLAFEVLALSESVSTDVTRFHLNGVYFDHENETAVSTDGHRMAVSPLVYQYFSGQLDKTKKLIYDARALTQGLLAPIDQNDVKYPNWKALVPNNTKHEFKNFKLPELVSFLDKDKIRRPIVFHLGLDKITTALESIPDFGIMKLAVNPKYLYFLASDELELDVSFNDELSPVLFKNNDFNYVVMPMRL